MRVPREKKMKSKKVRKFLPAIRCESVLGSVLKKRLPAPTALVNLGFDLGFEFEASS